MKALSLWQPWASMLFLKDSAGEFLKWAETRSWGTNYRGKLVIHAAKRPVDHWEIVGILDDLETAGADYRKLPLGAALGIVEVTNCQSMTPELITLQSERERRAGNWERGRVAIYFGKDRILFPEPILMRGSQGFWETPEGVIP